VARGGSHPAASWGERAVQAALGTGGLAGAALCQVLSKGAWISWVFTLHTAPKCSTAAPHEQSQVYTVPWATKCRQGCPCRAGGEGSVVIAQLRWSAWKRGKEGLTGSAGIQERVELFTCQLVLAKICCSQAMQSLQHSLSSGLRGKPPYLCPSLGGPACLRSSACAGAWLWWRRISAALCPPRQGFCTSGSLFLMLVLEVTRSTCSHLFSASCYSTDTAADLLSGLCGGSYSFSWKHRLLRGREQGVSGESFGTLLFYFLKALPFHICVVTSCFTFSLPLQLARSVAGSCVSCYCSLASRCLEQRCCNFEKKIGSINTS